MRPRRFPASNKVFRLTGGTEDNDLFVEQGTERGVPYIRSLWVPTDEEREAIAAGENISLVIIGTEQPPVQLFLTAEQPGRPT